MLAPLRYRNFTLLWLGGLLSSIGDLILFIALPFYTYDLTGSTLATGTMFVAQVLPALLLGPLAGVSADRWDRKRTLIGADVLRAAILLPLLLIRSADDVWIAYVVACGEATISQFFNPAKGALIPAVVSEQRLVAANTLTAFSMTLTGLLAPPLGGVLADVLGFHSLVVLDSASYLMSATLIALVSINRSSPLPRPPAPSHLSTGWHSIRHDMGEGIALVRHHGWLPAVFAVSGITMVAQGIITILTVPYINTILGGDAQLFGWIIMAQSLGGLVGGLLLSKLNERVAPVHIVTFSIWLFGGCWLLVANSAAIPLVLIAVALSGVPAVGLNVTLGTLVQASVADEYRGRVLGAFGTLQSLLLIVGMGGASVLGDWLGVRMLFNGVVALCILAGGVAWIRLRHSEAQHLLQSKEALGAP